MHIVTLECKTVTPMFSGNAFQKPEIRPTEIKAAMRFWWRAMNAHLPLDEMRKNETKIFGGSYKVVQNGQTVEKHLKASFTIDVINPVVAEKHISKDLGEYLKIQKKKSQQGRWYYEPDETTRGIAYLLYSTFMLNERSLVKPGVEFEIKIQFKDISKWKEIHDSLLALQIFGGIGARSRRGAGAFKITNVSFCGNPNFTNDLVIDNKSTLKQQIISFQTKLKPAKINDISRMKDSEIYIFGAKNNWNVALNTVGTIYTNFRSNNKTRVIETPEFGFPVLHRNRNIFKAGLRTNNKWTFLDRRSSPIIIKVFQAGENEFIPLIMHLKGDLLPDNYVICDKNGRDGRTPDGKIVDQFFELCVFKKAIKISL